MYSNHLFTGMPVPITASPMALPLADCAVRAGFPSPAEDFSGKRLDLSTMLVEHPPKPPTFCAWLARPCRSAALLMAI
jgi:DNA polymerase V